LDGDDGLGRERTKQLDVHIAEQANLGPADSNSADGASVPQHWHCKQCAKTGGKSCVLNLVIRVHANIRNLDDRSLMDRARRASRGARLHRESATQSFDPCRNGAKDGVEMHQFAIEAGGSAYLAAAQLGGTFSDKIKQRLRLSRSYLKLREGFRWSRPEHADSHPSWEGARYFPKRATRLNLPSLSFDSRAAKPVCGFPASASPTSSPQGPTKDYFFTSEHLLSLSGCAASSAGMRRRTL